MSVTDIEELIQISRSTYYTFPVKINDTVLVVAPHPDDETLGCGGTIAGMLNKGIDVKVLLLTNGNGGGRQRNISEIRMNEFQKACKILGVKSINYLGFQDSTLDKCYEKLKIKLQEFIDEFEPKLIFVPYIFDHSIDHQCACNAILEINVFGAEVVMYEVWTPMLYPDYYINVTKEYDIKKLSMQCYESQEKYYGLIDKTETINKLRSHLSMHRNSKYMECFKKINGWRGK